MMLGIFAINLTACDRFLRSSKSEQDQDARITVETTQELSCMKQVPAKLKRFADDQANNADLPEAVQCLQNSLRTFMKYTTGNDANLYTGREIQHFFNRYLLKENQISDSFQAEIMKAKVIFVGGSSDTFSRAELEKLIQFLGTFGDRLQSLQGRMKLLLLRKKENEISAGEIDKTQKLVRDLVVFFLEQTKITASKYELNDLITLIQRLDDFLGENDQIQGIFKWVPLIKDVKKLFMGESANLSNMTEWKSAFLWTVDSYFAVIKFHHLVKDLKFENPNDWNILMPWLDQIFRLIENSPEMQKNKILQAGGIDAVIDQIYELKLFRSEVDRELAKKTYRKAIAYILNRSANRDSAVEVAGLTVQNLNIISQEYHIWRLSQQFLVDTFIKAQRLKVILNIKNIRAEFDKYDFNKVIDSFGVNAIEKEDLVQSWNDFRSFIFTATPVIANQDGKMRMQGNLSDQGTSLAGGNLLNSARSYVRIIMRGYADRKEKFLFQNTIPKQSFLNLEEDFREFAQKMGFIDPRNFSPAARTFTEANFLTYNGDGNELMSPTEAVQLISQMFSGGRTIANELFADLGKVDEILKRKNKGNCYSGQTDIFNKPVVHEACFKAVFKVKSVNYFEAMPNTKAYISKMSPEQYELYYKTIMIPAGLEKHRPGMVEYAEARSIIVIMHYIESLMVVYDKNQDQVLDEKELLSAMPRFDKMIAKMSPLGNWFVEDIFLSMVYKGEKPSIGSLLKFKAERAKGLGTVDRLNIIKVLALLKEQAKADAMKRTQAETN